MSDLATEQRTTASTRGVRRIVAMEIVSGVGDGVFWVGLAAVLVERGAGAAGLAVAALVRLGPRALLSAPTSAWADRYPRRAMLRWIDLLRAACMVALALAASAGAGEIVLLVPVAVSYSIAAPYRPAITAALPLVAGERDLALANAHISTVRQVMTFVGPLIGALVVASAGVVAAFWLNSCTFVVAALLVSTVRSLDGSAAPHRQTVRARSAPSMPAGSPAGSDADRSWRAAMQTPGLAVIGWSVFVMYVVRGAEIVLYPLIAVRLGLGDGGIGVLTGAIGLGAIAALPLSTRAAEDARPDLTVLASLAATAVPLAMVSASSTALATCVVLVVLGAAVVVFEVVSVVSLQRLADAGALARVFGVVNGASNGGKLIGAVVAPILVAAFGVRGSLLALAALVVALGLGAAPALRSLARATSVRSRALQPTVDVLSGLGLFEGASPSALERLAAAVTEVAVGGGSAVIREGDVADDLYVVRRGEFDALIGGRVVNTVGPDGWFGEIGLLQRVPRTATVVARADAIVWRIPGPAFLAALGDVAAMPTALISEMSERLRRTAEVTG